MKQRDKRGKREKRNEKERERVMCERGRLRQSWKERKSLKDGGIYGLHLEPLTTSFFTTCGDGVSNN